ncbi:hypothetical protein O9993_14675 [Vibrio lentus]|nr:hypothetical protein [Vibrio lentus]
MSVVSSGRNGPVVAIAEQKDATDEQKLIKRDQYWRYGRKQVAICVGHQAQAMTTHKVNTTWTARRYW